MTRFGSNTKYIFLGDSDQIDIPNPKQSCLKYYVDNFKDFPGFGIVELEPCDEVRNPLIGKYLEKLKMLEENEDL